MINQLLTAAQTALSFSGTSIVLLAMVGLYAVATLRTMFKR